MKIKCRPLNKEELEELKTFYQGQAGRKVRIYRQGEHYIVQALPVPKNPRAESQGKSLNIKKQWGIDRKRTGDKAGPHSFL